MISSIKSWNCLVSSTENYFEITHLYGKEKERIVGIQVVDRWGIGTQWCIVLIEARNKNHDSVQETILKTLFVDDNSHFWAAAVSSFHGPRLTEVRDEASGGLSRPIISDLTWHYQNPLLKSKKAYSDTVFLTQRIGNILVFDIFRDLLILKIVLKDNTWNIYIVVNQIIYFIKEH